MRICFYAPTQLLFEHDPRNSQLMLSVYDSGFLHINRELGALISVFDSELLDPRYVHYFGSLPGLTPPVDGWESSISESTSAVHVASPPSFDLKTHSFITRIDISGDFQIIPSDESLSVRHISPCAIMVICGAIQHQCNFPFPVNQIKASIRDSVSEVWIQAVALIVGTSDGGLYSLEPFPLVQLHDEIYLNRNLPFINFTKLPKLNIYDNRLDLNAKHHECVMLHLSSMFSNDESERRRTLPDNLKSVKNTIHNFLWPEKSKHAFILMPSKKDCPPMLFLISGIYLDVNSHSVVVEAYVVPDTSVIGKGSNVVVGITVGENVIKFWKSALPALAERCRTWQHKPSCEYTREFGAQETRPLSLCSCGLGKVGKDFTTRKVGKSLRPTLLESQSQQSSRHPTSKTQGVFTKWRVTTGFHFRSRIRFLPMRQSVAYVGSRKPICVEGVRRPGIAPRTVRNVIGRSIRSLVASEVESFIV